MDIANELTAKVMGQILAQGMSLSDVDLSKAVNGEAVTALGKIKTALSDGNDDAQKLERVQRIVSEYRWK